MFPDLAMDNFTNERVEVEYGPDPEPVVYLIPTPGLLDELLSWSDHFMLLGLPVILFTMMFLVS